LADGVVAAAGLAEREHGFAVDTATDPRHHCQYVPAATRGSGQVIERLLYQVGGAVDAA
jgi:hypothetical protein